jgi:hypothetical protein
VGWQVGASVLGGVWQVGVGVLLGVVALGWAVGFFALATRFFQPQRNPLFPRLLMLSNPLKYPLLLVLGVPCGAGRRADGAGLRAGDCAATGSDYGSGCAGGSGAVG